MRRLCLFVLLSLLSYGAYSAPVALVEDLSEEVTSVQLLDFLSLGDVVTLKPSATLTLGYLDSCTREEIKGGTVTIGEQQSEVNGGSVARQQTQCDGGRLLLVAEQAVHSGAVAVRAAPGNNKVSLTVHDVSPVLILPKAAKVVIKRIDKKGERYRIKPEPNDSRIRLDLALQQISLTPGGQYMVSSAGRSMVFEVSEDAGHNSADLLGRLIPL